MNIVSDVKLITVWLAPTLVIYYIAVSYVPNMLYTVKKEEELLWKGVEKILLSIASRDRHFIAT